MLSCTAVKLFLQLEHLRNQGPPDHRALWLSRGCPVLGRCKEQLLSHLQLFMMDDVGCGMFREVKHFDQLHTFNLIITGKEDGKDYHHLYLKEN